MKCQHHFRLHLSLAFSGCKQISLMQSNLKFSTYLHSQTRKRNCLRWLSPFSSTANLSSLCRLSTGKKHETFGKMKERWKSLWRSLSVVKVSVAASSWAWRLDWWKLQPFSPGCLGRRFSSFLGMDPQFQSQLWVSDLENVAWVFSFVNLCRLQMPSSWSNMVREGCISNHAKSTQEFHPPLKLRQPMKAHFNGKGRPNDFFPPRKPFRFGPWPSEVFLFPRFQRMMKPRLFIFIPDEYNTFHDFLLHPLKWVKLMITETDDRPKVWK